MFLLLLLMVMLNAVNGILYNVAIHEFDAGFDCKPSAIVNVLAQTCPKPHPSLTKLTSSVVDALLIDRLSEHLNNTINTTAFGTVELNATAFPQSADFPRLQVAYNCELTAH